MPDPATPTTTSRPAPEDSNRCAAWRCPALSPIPLAASYPDGGVGGLGVEAGRGLGGEAFGDLRDVAFGGEDGGGGVGLAAGAGHAEQRDAAAVGDHRVHGRVQLRDAMPVQLRGDGHDHIGAVEHLGLDEAAVAVDRHRDHRRQLRLAETVPDRGAAGGGGTDLGAKSSARCRPMSARRRHRGHQVGHRLMGFGGPVETGGDLRALYDAPGPALSSISRDRFESTSSASSGIPAIGQPPRRPERPSSDSMPYPSSTARRAEASRPMAVAAWSWSRTNAVSSAFHPPGRLASTRRWRSAHGRGFGGRRPVVVACRDVAHVNPAGLRPRLPLRPGGRRRPDHGVEVGHGRVALGVDDGVHVLGPADHPQLGHALGRRDDQLHTRPRVATSSAPVRGSGRRPARRSPGRPRR